MSCCRKCPKAARLADEEDLRVLRQRPEVVGDDLLELVGDLADVGHRGELVVARVLGELEALDPVGVDVGLLELVDRLVRCDGELRGLAADSGPVDVGGVDRAARWRSAAGMIIVFAMSCAVSASMLALVMYCSSQTS